jgi:N-acetylglucosamine-6-phosphate deacetylase
MPELTGRSVLTGKPLSVTVEDGKIARTEDLADIPGGKEPAGKALPWISPGFLDIQVNGFNGIDYSLEDLEADQIESLILRLGESGTTRHVPTFVTMPNERLLRNLSLAAETMEKRPLVKAAIPGFHLEGPFISPEDGPRGAHNKKYTCPPDFSLFEEWQKAARGLIKYITLAPELPGAIDFIREAVKSGVKVAIGHTAASAEDIRAAAEAGASGSTHLGNGSHALIPRLRNYIWEQMADDSLWAGIICDGFHLPPAVVKVISRAKQPKRLFLVSDAALLGGYKPGLYKWGDLDVEVFADGHLGLPGTSALAGAAHLLDWDIAHYMEFTGASLKEAIALCTVQPASFLGLDTAEYTCLVPGNPANLTLFDFAPGDKRLNIRRTILAERIL